MTNLKFDKNRSRVKNCPCGKSNKDGKFVPYIGHHDKGYCHSCGETFLPEFSKDEVFSRNPLKQQKPKAIQQKTISVIPLKIFKESLQPEKDVLQVAEQNNFIRFLIALFGTQKSSELMCKYFIATSEYRQGATIFWQVDSNGKIRTGKIILYDPSTGKRNKGVHQAVSWAHNILKISSYNLQQCFFGEHLLVDDQVKPVAICESEKTAIIASVYLPEFVWLACGSLTGLSDQKCETLRGRNVVLFPDLNGFEKWSMRANELSFIPRFSVSDLLEGKATEPEKKDGLDLVDYLIRFDYKKFETTKPETIIPVNPIIIQPPVEINHFNPAKLAPEKEEKPKPENWNNEIARLVQYFGKFKLPAEPLKLNRNTIISDVSLFIEGHLANVKANNGKLIGLPYLQRLEELELYLKSRNDIDYIEDG